MTHKTGPRFRFGDLPSFVAMAFFASAMSLGAYSEAEGQISVGGQGVYRSQLFDGTFGVGGRVLIDVPVRRGLGILGTYDHMFPDCSGCSSYQASASVVFSQGQGLYVGGGATFNSFDRGIEFDGEQKTEEWAGHFLLGFSVPNVPVVTPFGEVRYEIGDIANETVISIGAYFGF